MRAIAVDDDRAGADFREFGALHERAADRHRMGRFTANADDGRGAFPQSEDAEQMHVLVGAAGELAAEQRGGLVGRDLRVRGGSGQRRTGRGGERNDPVGQGRAKRGEQCERQKADLNGVHAHIVRTIVKIALGESTPNLARNAGSPRGRKKLEGAWRFLATLQLHDIKMTGRACSMAAPIG